MTWLDVGGQTEVKVAPWFKRGRKGASMSIFQLFNLPGSFGDNWSRFLQSVTTTSKHCREGHALILMKEVTEPYPF